jgi:hypothetical protein
MFGQFAGEGDFAERRNSSELPTKAGTVERD